MPMLLVAEDNDLNRDVLVRQLEYLGYSPMEAIDGKEAIERAEAEQPDLILLDLSMPVMDGWEAVGILKQQESTAEIPVIALTAHTVAVDREDALEAGCDDYLAKPVDMSELEATIESWLE